MQKRFGLQFEIIAAFLASALPLAVSEKGTVHWFALKFDETTFGIFDTFETDDTRQAHLTGEIAAALMAKPGELLAEPPKIEPVELLTLAAKS